MLERRCTRRKERIMLENEFYEWLLNNNYDSSTSKSRKNNCLRVCAYEGDLDNHFEFDQCSGLLEKLTYSTNDQLNNRKTKHKIPIKGNIRTGSATLKQAVILYIKFKRDEKSGFIIKKSTKIKNIQVKMPIRTKIKKEWPTWTLPSDEEIFELAKITTRYIRFLNPEIVNAITIDNKNHYEKWYESLNKKKINCKLYLWENSPCCFPGIRRYAGSREIAYYRKQNNLEKKDIPNALKLDDNDFPKQIWSFTFRGLQFSKFGPISYSLAHLIDHKESKNRMSSEFEFTNDNVFTEPYYGLYTCPSNTVYIPNSLIKPTDFNLTLRKLMFQKAASLYKDYCNIVPLNIKIPETSDVKWDIANFEWADTVGNLDNIENFLKYRESVMDKLIKEDF
jgi:hypothetical protein